MSQITAHFGVALIFMPLILGLASLMFFQKSLARVALRVGAAPSAAAPGRPPMPKTPAAWFRYVGERALAIMVFIGLFTTTLRVALMLLVAATASMGYLLYRSHIAPLSRRGATQLETHKLIALLVVCLACFDAFVFTALTAFYRVH